MPSVFSRSSRFIVIGNVSAARASVAGDAGVHIIEVATSAGTIVAGLKAEFERERVLLLSLGLGDDSPELDEPGVDGRR